MEKIGGRFNEKYRFSKKKIEFGWPESTILHGGDVDENADFQTREVGMQGRNFLFKEFLRLHIWHHLLGEMLRKLAIFNVGKYVHMVTFFWHHRLGSMLRKLAIFKEDNTFTW